jgi:hypothetical protein
MEISDIHRNLEHPWKSRTSIEISNIHRNPTHPRKSRTSIEISNIRGNLGVLSMSILHNSLAGFELRPSVPEANMMPLRHAARQGEKIA